VVKQKEGAEDPLVGNAYERIYGLSNSWVLHDIPLQFAVWSSSKPLSLWLQGENREDETAAAGRLAPRR
jgi:hypothetical protein